MALIVSQAGSQAETRRLQRAADAGELRRIHAGVYTDDLKSPLEAVTRRELYPLLAAVAPDAVISHRSALESGPTKAKELFLTGEYRREIELPGLLLRIDRKSTRLNSSHSQISYAVFCLKKKKKKETDISIYKYLILQ